VGVATGGGARREGILAARPRRTDRTGYRGRTDSGARGPARFAIAYACLMQPQAGARVVVFHPSRQRGAGR